MRTLDQLPIIQDSDTKFPFGSTVQNETETQEGTPIVRELLGDIFQNVYKVLKETNTVPSDDEDSDDTQYQFFDALRKLPNTLNDVEQVLTLDGTIWQTTFDLDLLPNKYFYLARASESYIPGTTYTFKGSGSTEYGFVTAGFSTGDLVLVVIDLANVRAYSLMSSSSTASNEVFTVLGTPLSHNNSNKIWYQDGGKLMSDVPSVNDIQSTLQIDVADVSLVLLDAIAIDTSILCFCHIPTGNKYFFRQFPLNDFSVSTAVTVSGASFASASDFLPYIYGDQKAVYVTNNLNADNKDYSLTKLNYNSTTSVLTFVSVVDLDNSFDKTTNAAIKSGSIYTMVSGVLSSYSLTTGVKTSLGTYPSVIGQLFSFNGNIYYSSGEVAKKWF